MRGRTRFLAGALLLAACSGGTDGDRSPHTRYEPNERIDSDNYLYFSEPGMIRNAWNASGSREYFDIAYEGGMPRLPDEVGEPPRSGFRLGLPRVVLEPFQEIEFCQSWPVLEGLTHRFVYSAALHTGPAVHHANMFAVPIARDESDRPVPNPYPNCRTPNEALGASFGGLFSAAAQNDLSLFRFPQVMFANSTQVVGTERYTQPEGFAFEIFEGSEIVVQVHLLNPTAEPLVVETAWDFYTMPEAHLVHETQAFTWFWLDFHLPAQSEKTLTTQCEFFGDDDATILSLMPHVHQWTPGFSVDLLDSDGSVLSRPYDRRDLQTNDSWIESYEPPLGMAGVREVQFSCHYNNDTDHDMANGNGENEMCFLFGYVSPPEALSAGMIVTEHTPCFSAPFGKPEELAEVSLLGWALENLPPEVLAELLGGLSHGADSTRPAKTEGSR